MMATAKWIPQQCSRMDSTRSRMVLLQAFSSGEVMFISQISPTYGFCAIPRAAEWRIIGGRCIMDSEFIAGFSDTIFTDSRSGRTDGCILRLGTVVPAFRLAPEN